MLSRVHQIKNNTVGIKHCPQNMPESRAESNLHFLCFKNELIYFIVQHIILSLLLTRLNNFMTWFVWTINRMKFITKETRGYQVVGMIRANNKDTFNPK